MSYTIIKADEELPPAEAPSDAVWERAPLIKSHKNVDTPNTITEFAVTGDSGRYTTPEIIFGNNDLVIFEKEDGEKHWFFRHRNTNQKFIGKKGSQSTIFISVTV